MRSRTLTTMLVTIGLTAGAGYAAGDESTAGKLFEAKCSRCHPTSRPLGKNKDRAGWERTVKRMQGKNPGHLNDEEAATIIEHLVQIRGE